LQPERRQRAWPVEPRPFAPFRRPRSRSPRRLDLGPLPLRGLRRDFVVEEQLLKLREPTVFFVLGHASGFRGGPLPPLLAPGPQLPNPPIAVRAQVVEHPLVRRGFLMPGAQQFSLFAGGHRPPPPPFITSGLRPGTGRAIPELTGPHCCCV